MRHIFSLLFLLCFAASGAIAQTNWDQEVNFRLYTSTGDPVDERMLARGAYRFRTFFTCVESPHAYRDAPRLTFDTATHLFQFTVNTIALTTDIVVLHGTDTMRLMVHGSGCGIIIDSLRFIPGTFDVWPHRLSGTMDLADSAVAPDRVAYYLQYVRRRWGGRENHCEMIPMIVTSPADAVPPETPNSPRSEQGPPRRLRFR